MCKNYDSSKRSLVTTLIVVAVCLVIVTGSTFSLFTSKTGANIAITAGNVKYEATINALALYSKGEVQTGAFANGGTAELTNNNQTLTLTNITPGDKVELTINMVNSSNVKSAYRVLWTSEANTFADLKVSIKNADDTLTPVNYGTSEWVYRDALAENTTENFTTTLVIELPLEAGNANQNKSAKINFAVEAVQANGTYAYAAYVNTEAGLQAAIDAGATEIILNGDIDLANGLSFGTFMRSRSGEQATEEDNGITINLNGFKITAANDDVVIVNVDKNVTFVGGTIEVDVVNYATTAIENTEVNATVTSSGANAVLALNNASGTVEIKTAEEGKATVTGGNFSADSKLPEDSIAEGYKPVENPDGTQIIVPDSSIEADLYIANVAQLKAFAIAVNGGESYAGKTVVLVANIDLANVEWTPIGKSGASFNGKFDGQGYTVSNLTVVAEGKSNIGFFGFTQNGSVKNINFENAIVTGRLNVGVVSGTPYTSTFDNITIKGHVEVNGLAYVGGALGKNAYANVSNVTIEVDETSYVKAYSIENGSAYRTYVGGVIGFMGEGGHVVSNITSNIDVYGSTCDVGGIVGIAHYGNKFENITCTGDVYVTDAAEAADAEEMGGIAGVWHNQSGYTVTLNNCVFTGKLYANVDADLYNNTIVGAAYNKTGNGTLVIDGKQYVAVNTAEELVVALENKNNVIFVDNIKIEPAKMSNAYGTTGVNVKYGQTIDGNGYTLDIKGAGGTWDSGINTTGGVIKNLKVTGSFRGIFINHTSTYSEKVVLDNVIIDGTTYTISCDQGLNQGLEAINCTFNGWTSFAATIGNVKFVNCNFGKGNGYAFCRPYAPTVFENCVFSEDYAIDTTRTTVEFVNCGI